MSATSSGSEERSTPAIASALFSSSASRAASRPRRYRTACRRSRRARRPRRARRAHRHGSRRTVPRPRWRANAHALAERHEAVVGARHQHAVFAALLQLLRQRLGEFEHDRLFHLAARRDGAGIRTAMAGIDHDQRAAVIAGASTCRARASSPRGRRRFSSASVRMKLARSIDTRSSTSRAGWPSDGREHERLVDAHRAGRVDHDARAALHHQAVAECLDQAARLLAGARGKLEGHLRQVDHDAVRVGQREGRDVDAAAQIHHQPGAAASPPSRASLATGNASRTGRRRRPRQIGMLGRTFGHTFLRADWPGQQHTA